MCGQVRQPCLDSQRNVPGVVFSVVLGVFSLARTRRSRRLGSVTTELKNYLTKRGYKDNFVKEQIRRAKRISRNEALQEHTPESRSSSLIIQLFPTSTKSSIGNNPFFTPQNVLVKSSKKHLSLLTVALPTFVS